MRTIRRLYFYIITVISVEVIIWGVISLARTLFSQGKETDSGFLLATGLSLLIVGLPIFLLHWTNSFEAKAILYTVIVEHDHWLIKNCWINRTEEIEN